MNVGHGCPNLEPGPMGYDFPLAEGTKVGLNTRYGQGGSWRYDDPRARTGGCCG